MSPEVTPLTHILAALVVLPLLGSLSIGLSRFKLQPRHLALGFATLELCLVVCLLLTFDTGRTAVQFGVHYPLPWGLAWSVGVDGASVLFILVTALLVFFLALNGLTDRSGENKIPVQALLGFEGLLMGVFSSDNLLLFGVLSALEWIPTAFLLGGAGRHAAARADIRLYWQFATTALILLWAGILLLGWQHAETSGTWSYALNDLRQTPLPEPLQRIAFVLIFQAAAIRLAFFPLHTWLPRLLQHPLSPSVVVLLAGGKVGLYLLLRFVLPLLPEAVLYFRPLVAALAVMGIFYGAVLALMQFQLPRLLAFALVSKTGMLLVGIFSLNPEGLNGSLLLSFNFSVGAAGLFLTADNLLKRTRTALLPRLGALFDPLPLLAISFLISVLSTMAMPGTPGFDAAHLLLEGAIEAHSWGMTLAVAMGNVLSAAFMLYAFQRIFLAPGRDSSRHRVQGAQLYGSENLLYVLIGLTLVGVGFYVEPWLDLVEEASTEMVKPYLMSRH